MIQNFLSINDVQCLTCLCMFRLLILFKIICWKCKLITLLAGNQHFWNKLMKASSIATASFLNLITHLSLLKLLSDFSLKIQPQLLFWQQLHCPCLVNTAKNPSRLWKRNVLTYLFLLTGTAVKHRMDTNFKRIYGFQLIWTLLYLSVSCKLSGLEKRHFLFSKRWLITVDRRDGCGLAFLIKMW